MFRGVFLITFPWLAIPLYLIFGNNEFLGYAKALQAASVEHHKLVSQVYSNVLEFKAVLPEKLFTLGKLAEKFTPLPFTVGNEVELLINAQQTFESMLQAIAEAQDYILLQSYIINNDRVGNEFKEALIAKASRELSLTYSTIRSLL